MPALNVPGGTTTVTSYTLAAATITVASSAVLVGSVNNSYPVYCGIYRGQNLLTVHTAIGKPTATTIRTSGPYSGYQDVALQSGDVVVPYVDPTGLARFSVPPFPGGLPFAAESPSAHGLAEWAFPPSSMGTLAGTTATNGTQYFARWVPQVVTTVNNLAVYLGTAGLTPTAADNWIGLFGPTGTQIALSADQTTAFATAGLICAAMVTPVAVVPGTVYYIGFLNTASTAAKLLCATSPVTVLNFTGTAASLPYSTNGTSKTTMDTSITVASNVVTNALGFWWGVNGTATS